MAQMLVNLDGPTAMGVILRKPQSAFDDDYWHARPTERRARVKELLRSGNMLDRR